MKTSSKKRILRNFGNLEFFQSQIELREPILFQDARTVKTAPESQLSNGIMKTFRGEIYGRNLSLNSEKRAFFQRNQRSGLLFPEASRSTAAPAHPLSDPTDRLGGAPISLKKCTFFRVQTQNSPLNSVVKYVLIIPLES